ncbi:ketopantoate reductase family protein [Streptomyces sp. MAR4 CNX-425]|uniref:ketopantoate reductase family protein n=1 Tax=Streptomyces sp. MAR4 CNX-425 TaxID=3406343 RepID=UPI003B50E786
MRRWLVVGAGGIGGYFGGLLAHAGMDVTFLARGGHLAALRSDGLHLETVDGAYHVPRVRALGAVTGGQPYDVVLFCVKTYDNTTAAAGIAPAVGDGTVVISVQNGIGNDDVLRAALPGAQVFPGFAHIVSARVAPGRIRQSGGPRTLIYGDPEHPDREVLRDIEAELRSAGVDATASTDILRDQWSKFAFIVAFSGMTALCRTPIGPILRDEAAMLLYRRCVAEAVAVARAIGVAATEEAVLTRTEAYRGAQEGATSSMLRDLLAGRATEVASLNGAIVELAAAHGIDAPVNSAIHTAVALAEAVGG